MRPDSVQHGLHANALYSSALSHVCGCTVNVEHCILQVKTGIVLRNVVLRATGFRGTGCETSHMICTPMFPLLTSRILSLPISPSMAHPVCVTQPWHNKQPCVSTAQHHTSRISSFHDGSARLSILCYSKGLTHGQRSPRYPLARGEAQVPGLLRLLPVLLVDNSNVLLALRRTRSAPMHRLSVSLRIDSIEHLCISAHDTVFFVFSELDPATSL